MSQYEWVCPKCHSTLGGTVTWSEAESVWDRRIVAQQCISCGHEWTPVDTPLLPIRSGLV